MVTVLKGRENREACSVMPSSRMINRRMTEGEDSSGPYWARRRDSGASHSSVMVFVAMTR
jgi:hypothetical protein